MVRKARFQIFNLPKLTVHTEPVIMPKENDRRQNANTMPGRERGRWGKNLQLPTMVRTIKTINEKKIRYRYWAANQRRNNERNRKGGKKETIQQDFLWALGLETTHQKHDLNT